MTLDLVLVGFGHVAQRFVTLLEERRQVLERDYDLSARVVGVATRRRGWIHSRRGIDVSRPDFLNAAVRNRHSSVAFIRESIAKSATATRQGRLVVVETTTLDIRRGQPAIDHVQAALAGRAHVVTANKGPAAFAYHRLARQAERAGRRFLFEGAVMDGIPIFNLVRETLPGVSILGFRGVVNSTTNYVLTAMEQGGTFADALAAMQRAGIAEADASLDVEGWDAAAKTAVLANVLLDARLTPQTIGREGIAALTQSRVADARARGRRMKLVASAERTADGSVRGRVAPVELPESDILARLDGQQNAIVFRTDLLEEIAIAQHGSGLTQTAYALVSDLVTIARDPDDRRGSRRARASTRRGRSR